MPKKAQVNVNDVLSIPYGKNKAVAARVLGVDSPKVPRKYHRGLYVEALDFDVSPTPDMAAIAKAKPLLVPIFTLYEALTDKSTGWKLIGHAEFPKEPKLPNFLWGEGVVDYYQNDLPDTPANRKTAIVYEIAPPEELSRVVAAVRGKKLGPEFAPYLPKSKGSCVGFHPLEGKAKLYASDAATDAMRDALERISEQYLGRFGRRPALKEIMHAVSAVLYANADDFVLDIDSLDKVSALAKKTEPPRLPVLPDGFKASWREEPQPTGEYDVERRDDGTVVLRARLRMKDDVLFADYDRVDTSLNEDDAECLIICTICKEFTGDHYATKAIAISLGDTAEPGIRHEVRYPIES